MKALRGIRNIFHWRSLIVLVLGLWVAWEWIWRAVDHDANWTQCEVMKPEAERRLNVQLASIGVATLAGMIVLRRRPRPVDRD